MEEGLKGAVRLTDPVLRDTPRLPTLVSKDLSGDLSTLEASKGEIELKKYKFNADSSTWLKPAAFLLIFTVKSYTGITPENSSE